LADFDNYADLVFRAFGDRVQNWITHNEVSEMGLSMPIGLLIPLWTTAPNLLSPQCFGIEAQDFRHESRSMDVSVSWQHMTGPLISKVNTEADLSHLSRLGNNLLLTHARAVDLYRRKYQKDQKGIIGITLVSVSCQSGTVSRVSLVRSS
jgi:beta-glucosidase